jgi:hypothetical protein
VPPSPAACRQAMGDMFGDEGKIPVHPAVMMVDLLAVSPRSIAFGRFMVHLTLDAFIQYLRH